jgi:hypothetical protein
VPFMLWIMICYTPSLSIGAASLRFLLFIF